MPKDCRSFIDQLLVTESPVALKDIDSLLDTSGKILMSQQLSKVGAIEVMA